MDMIIALLAVAKVGAAYIPISPDYPESRIQFILEDASASIFITHSTLKAKVTGIFPENGLLLLDVEKEK